jgi:hypothetical protein
MILQMHLADLIFLIRRVAPPLHYGPCFARILIVAFLVGRYPILAMSSLCIIAQSKLKVNRDSCLILCDIFDKSDANRHVEGAFSK